MNKNTPLIKKSSFWTLALGVAIGGASMASLHGPAGVTKALANEPAMTRPISNLNAESMATLHALDASLSSLAEAVEPSVVHIDVSSKRVPGLMGPVSVSGEGSGVIFRPDGYIVTNDHVVDGMDTVNVVLTDGRQFVGKVIRSDFSGDIAVIKINATGLPSVPFADSNKVKPGQMAMAIGSPFGLDNSVTIGHISALDRPQAISDPHSSQGTRVYPDLIQTDAAINPGNSGGALVNVDGELIGINTAIASSTGGSNGIGFAIPSNQAKMIAEILISKGTVKPAFLGVIPEALKPIQKKELGISTGAYIATDPPNGSPAEAAGIHKGDVVTRIGSSPITTFMDLRNSMYRYAPGDSVDVEYFRNGASHQTRAKLEAPAAPRVQQNMNQFPQGQDPFNGAPFGQGPQFDFQVPRGNRGRTQAPTVRTGPVHLGAAVAPLNSDLRAQFNVPASAKGVVVLSVEPGSVAEEIGLQAGDVISALGGGSTNTPDELVQRIKGLKWGESCSISIDRWPASDSHETQKLNFNFK